MCGIAGVLGKDSRVGKTVLEAIVSSLKHRGPDDEGIEYFCADETEGLFLGLAHSRLSIIDLTEKGRQPMCSEDGTIWITHNGEIYNYLELRDELKTRGHRFKSNSDTEVIIHAYQEWDKDCLHKLQGMFAFSIWDKRKKILFSAVDRFGMKPLYYYNAGDGLFVFASEVRSILRSGFIKKHVNPLAVDSFLAYGAIQAPFTVIDKVYSLLPAHYFTYRADTGELKIDSYWNVSDDLSEKPLCGREVINQFQDVLRRAVKRHLISDVPVGLFLSGGIDSSSVAILANELAKGTLESFSVTFEESAFSEEKYSRLIARLHCRNHTEIKISREDLLNSLPLALRAMDQPTIDGINTYVISRLVSQRGLKVALSGQGADEVLGGYSTFKRIPRIRQLCYLLRVLPYFLREHIGNIIEGGNQYHTTRTKLSQILKSDGNYLSVYLLLRQLFSPKARKRLIQSRSVEIINAIPSYVVESLLGELKHLDSFNAVSLLDLRLYLANTLLRDGDFMSMAHGLEIRMPFLDRELVEFVFNVSSKMKLSNRLSKPLLVNAMGSLLPKEVYLRPKMGFTFPWDVWLKSNLRPSIEEILNDASLNNEAGFNKQECMLIWSKFLKGRLGVDWARVWALYVFLQWYKINLAQ